MKSGDSCFVFKPVRDYSIASSRGFPRDYQDPITDVQPVEALVGLGIVVAMVPSAREPLCAKYPSLWQVAQTSSKTVNTH